MNSYQKLRDAYEKSKQECLERGKSMQALTEEVQTLHSNLANVEQAKNSALRREREALNKVENAERDANNVHVVHQSTAEKCQRLEHDLKDTRSSLLRETERLMRSEARVTELIRELAKMKASLTYLAQAIIEQAK